MEVEYSEFGPFPNSFPFHPGKSGKNHEKPLENLSLKDIGDLKSSSCSTEEVISIREIQGTTNKCEASVNITRIMQFDTVSRYKTGTNGCLHSLQSHFYQQLAGATLFWSNPFPTWEVLVTTISLDVQIVK